MALSIKKSVMGGVLAALALSTATPAFAWWETDYAYRTKLNLNASAAGVTGEVARAPVLVRLHQGNFNFADVNADGSDLRFVAGDDRTPLKFHVEKWDVAGQQALVWVDVQGLQPGQASAIYAYYGNKDAKPGQDIAGTVGGDYRLVYHFDAAGAPKDATANGATAVGGGAARNANGLIGQSLVLDGTAPVIVPASAFAANGASGPLSVSFWVKPGSDGTLFTLPGSVSLVSEGGQIFIAQGDKRSAGAALAAGSWANVALVNDGKKSLLYINGQPSGEVEGALAAASADAQLGVGFAGEVDELRVAGVALPQAMFQLAAASEGQGAKLVLADTAEQVETGGGHGYVGILFGALTLDAWIVIAILGVMFVLAAWTMWSKHQLFSRIERANDGFLDAYRAQAKRSGDHDGLPAFDPGAGAADSSLGQLYQIGRRELAERLKEGRATGSRFAIRAQSIAAIRSALDAEQVLQGQKLSERMGMLTNSISGGPFIGLAGTVLGVMITFASVAAAGEVNINAIAPGIAAALLATVAGLVVAIPAMFGYNALLARSKKITARNQIFADELEKRIAETWQDVPAAQAA
jgi:biopolymer transport protein ExbB